MVGLAGKSPVQRILGPHLRLRVRQEKTNFEKSGMLLAKIVVHSRGEGHENLTLIACF